MSEAFNACGHEPAQLHNEAICIFCYRDRLGAATAAMQHDHLDDVAILRRFRRKFTALAAQNAAPQSPADLASVPSKRVRGRWLLALHQLPLSTRRERKKNEN